MRWTEARELACDFLLPLLAIWVPVAAIAAAMWLTGWRW